MKGRALRRAIATNDVSRIGPNVPLITDTTELITPDLAYELLQRNKNNRPVNWKQVEEYASVMKRGEWQLHAQGIVLDSEGNILTGQTRLWAVIYADASIYMRVSKGTPAKAALVMDRGRPQSSRDLASRSTGRKHSPVEVSIGRAILALDGKLKPSTDDLAHVIESNCSKVVEILEAAKGSKKTRALLMVMAVVCVQDLHVFKSNLARLQCFENELQSRLLPMSAEKCWGRGAAFRLAMETARKIVEG
jgi:hypothetical protein